jgi:hypothetical protein
MNIAYISALSALGGSLIGGLVTGVTAWMSQRAQTRVAQQAHELSRREGLFADFIVAASKVYGEAVRSSEPQVEELIALYAMIRRMRMRCSPRTVACAEQVAERTIGAYFEPNKTTAEIYELIKSRKWLDPLEEFGEAAREELEGLSSVLLADGRSGVRQS